MSLSATSNRPHAHTTKPATPSSSNAGGELKMLENDETAQNLLIKSTIFSPKHTPQARFAFTGSIVFLV